MSDSEGWVEKADTGRAAWEAMSAVERQEDLQEARFDVAVSVIHECPPGDEGYMPCCNRTPFELPPTDRITTDPARVTCRTGDVT